MYGGENSGMPLGPDPVNNGTGTFGAENDYDQPAAIVSGGADGGAVAFDSSKSDKSSKYFGHRSREKAAKQSAPQVDMNLVAASNIANNPNNPEFFRQAAIDNTTAQIQRQPRQMNKKPIIIIAVLLLLAGAAVAAVLLWPKEKVLAGEDTMEKFNEFANYMLTGEIKKSKIGKKEYKDYKATLMARDITSSETRDYFTKAKELFGAFEEATKNDEGLKGNEVFEREFELYKGAFYVTYNDSQFVDLTDSQIMNSFYTSGEQATTDMIDRFFKTQYSEYMDNAGYYRMEYAKKYVERLSIYKKHSCISGSVVIWTCVDSIQDEALVKNSEELEMAYDQYNGSIISSRNTIADYLWNINDALEGKNEE